MNMGWKDLPYDLRADIAVSAPLTSSGLYLAFFGSDDYQRLIGAGMSIASAVYNSVKYRSVKLREPAEEGAPVSKTI